MFFLMFLFNVGVMESSIDSTPFLKVPTSSFHHRNINVDGQPEIFKAYFWRRLLLESS
jgi:hypothetical protein